MTKIPHGKKLKQNPDYNAKSEESHCTATCTRLLLEIFKLIPKKMCVHMIYVQCYIHYMVDYLFKTILLDCFGVVERAYMYQYL